MDISLDTINHNFNRYFSGGRHGFEFIRLESFAQKIGTSELLLRFLIGILLGYPLSLLYFLLPKHTQKVYKHLYFSVTGLLINYFCFGVDSLYNVFSVLVTYLSLQIFGATINNVIFTFIFQTSYLSVGYVMNASDAYDVKWTTPQCVLCLRLIGLMWNVYDGGQKEEKITPDQKKLSINYIPNIFEVFGYCYCYCGLLCGLQYSFKMYKDFVEGTLLDEPAKGKESSRFLESFKRFVGAWIVLITFTQLDPYYKCDDLLRPSFLEKPLLTKIMQMSFVYYVQYSKYVIVWWFGESVSMFAGLSYNGITECGKVCWDGVSNFKFRVFVFGAFYQDIVDGFNIHTNRWVGRYVFRRLKFIGNKTISHALTLLYLAVWHGFYVGYFIMFLIEFIYVMWERKYCSVCRNLFGVSFSELPVTVRIPLQAFGAFFKFVTCGFAAQSFLLLRWRKIKVVYATCYYWPAIIIGAWYIIINPVISFVVKDKPKQSSPSKKEE